MSGEDIVRGYMANELAVKLANEFGIEPYLLGAGGLVLGPENLGRRLWSAAQTSRQPVLVPLSVLATCLALVGLPRFMHRMAFLDLADNPERIGDMRALWEDIAEEYPFLRGRVEPLLGWLESATDGDNDAAAACFGVIAELDFTATIMKGMSGDILGAVANQLLWRHFPAWPRNAWADMPECLARVAPYVDDLHEGDMWGDLMCCTGTMAMALGWQLRARDRSPSELSWFLADFSETNVALTAVNLAVMGDYGDKVMLASSADIGDVPTGMKSMPRQVRAPKKPA